MKYTILEIINAFSMFNSLNEIEITTLFENINHLKSNKKYEKMLSEIDFNEHGISSELIGEIATSIINNDVVITNHKYLVFSMNNEIRTKIFDSIEDKGIYMNFMSDFIKLSIEKEKNNICLLKNFNFKKQN